LEIAKEDSNVPTVCVYVKTAAPICCRHGTTKAAIIRGELPSITLAPTLHRVVRLAALAAHRLREQVLSGSQPFRSRQQL